MTADGYRHSCLGVVGAIAILAVPVLARTSDGQIQPRSREAVVTGAPYVADSIVTVNLTGLGGPADAPVVQRVVARVYRDSAGRVRREQVPGAQDAPKPADSADLIVIILDPVASVVYSLNPATRTGVPDAARGAGANHDRTGHSPIRFRVDGIPGHKADRGDHSERPARRHHAARRTRRTSGRDLGGALGIIRSRGGDHRAAPRLADRSVRAPAAEHPQNRTGSGALRGSAVLLDRRRAGGPQPVAVHRDAHGGH